MKYNHVTFRKPKRAIKVGSKLLLKVKKSNRKVTFRKSEEDEIETEVILNQINLEEGSNHKIDSRLETIREESLETLTEEEEDQFEKSTSELITIIEVEKEFLNRSIEEFFFDLTSSTAEEELKILQMALFGGKENPNFIDDVEPNENIEENLSPYSLEEFEVYSLTGVEKIQIDNEPCPILDENPIDENEDCETVTSLAEKTSSTLTFVISNVQLECKPSSTHISVVEMTSESSISSLASQSDVKLKDFIAEKSTGSAFNIAHQPAVKTYDLTSDFRDLCYYIFKQIWRFFESPLAIYFVIFIGSVYITLSSVFYDTLNGAELVWNFFPENRPSSSALFFKRTIARYLSLKI